MAEIKVEKSATPPRREKPRPETPIHRNLNLTEQREEAVQGIFQIAGLGFIILGQYADAGAIDMHAPGIAHEAADLAQTNEGVAKGIDYLLQVGPYAGLIAVSMPLIMQLLVNHKVLPADKLSGANVVKPEVLESQVKTAMARQAMEAIKAQQEAERELAELQAEMMASQNGAAPTE